MRNHYHTLGIGQDASPAVVKIAFEGKLKALNDPRHPVPDAERKAEERILRDAFATLSIEAKRSAYDEKLAHAELNPRKGFVTNPSYGVFVTLVTALVVLGLGGYAYERSKDRDATRLEQERLALEREMAEKRAVLDRERLEASRARENASSQRALERSTQQNVSRERNELERWRQSVDVSARRSENESSRQVSGIVLERRNTEEQDRREAEMQRQAAQRDVDRQKEFVRQREAEEERIRTERHNRALAEQREREMRRAYEEAAARRK